MRISGGKARGIPLRACKAPELRPATEANRERLFSSLGQAVINARILDLFAGTGSYGLEALSRGAVEASFVEKNKKGLRPLGPWASGHCVHGAHGLIGGWAVRRLGPSGPIGPMSPWAHRPDAF